MSIYLLFRQSLQVEFVILLPESYFIKVDNNLNSCNSYEEA